ncbi:MAG TPA: adenosylcobinamide-GDP ribazoletransferase [Clostridiaceae bacterium]|nr:adenosylcobinamide-GDP ribazoletransferase [Clostridiaceae bacterium]
MKRTGKSITKSNIVENFNINIKRFIIMLQFITTIPIPVRIDADERDLGEGLVFAVPIGLLIGEILAVSQKVFALFLPPLVTAILLNIVYIRLTGGLHLDGLGDTFDGVLSYRSRERMLEIMRDSRVGSNAVLALMCILSLNTALYYEAGDFIAKMLVLMPVAGRMGMVIGAGISSYARSEGGLGKASMDFCNNKEIIVGLTMYIIIFACFRNLQFAAAGLAACIFSIAAAKFFGKKLDGLTGDVLGALCEMTQTCFMLTAFAFRFLGF